MREKAYRLVDAADHPLSTYDAVDDEDATAQGRVVARQLWAASRVFAVQRRHADGWTDVAAWVPALGTRS